MHQRIPRPRCAAMTSLPAFIRDRRADIITEWETFAGSGHEGLEQESRSDLREHVGSLLDFLADDVETPAAETDRPASAGTAEHHAEQRFMQGFDSLEMISEFCALRAGILRLWRRERGAMPQDCADLTRFSAAMDRIMSESLARYIRKEERARNLFLGALVHDLRNPLNAISGAAELLQLGALDPRQLMLVTQIGRSAKRIATLTGQLVDAIRIRLGKGVPLSKAPADMGRIARQVVKELQAARPGRHISLALDGGLDGEWDAQRMTQAVSNLVGNAVQHGDPEAPVDVRAAAEGGSIVLSVHNSGKPIPPDILPTLFDPMTRGRGGDSVEPTSLGLGLFITRNIIVAHGGELGVASSAEDGTTFTARIPRRSLRKSFPVRKQPADGVQLH